MASMKVYEEDIATFIREKHCKDSKFPKVDGLKGGGGVSLTIFLY